MKPDLLTLAKPLAGCGHPLISIIIIIIIIIIICFFFFFCLGVLVGFRPSRAFESSRRL